MRGEEEGACGPACAPFRQFFKIKSLSVLVKCISPETLPPRAPLRVPTAEFALLAPLARYCATLPPSIHVLRLMTDSWPRKKVCKSGGTRQTEIHGRAWSRSDRSSVRGDG